MTADLRRTGWPPGMLQDDSKQLSKWLSTHGCARALVDGAAEEIKARQSIMNIIQYTKTLEITVYSKSNCTLCDAAKRLLKSKGLVFEEYCLDEEEDREVFNKKHPAVRQMPYILINDQPVGGFAGLQAALTQLGL